jgi:hypothetical protein
MKRAGCRTRLSSTHRTLVVGPHGPSNLADLSAAYNRLVRSVKILFTLYFLQIAANRGPLPTLLYDCTRKNRNYAGNP